MTDRLEITDPADGSKQTLLVASGVVHLRKDGTDVVLSASAEGAGLRIVETKHGRRLEPLVPGALIEVSGQQLFCKDLAPGDRFEFAGKRLVWHSEVELPAVASAPNAASRSQRRSADGKPTSSAAARDGESERARPKRTDRSSRPLVFGLMSLTVCIAFVGLRFFDQRASQRDPRELLALARTRFESGQYDRARSTIDEAVAMDAGADVRAEAEALRTEIARTQKAVLDSVSVQKAREALSSLQSFVQRYGRERLQRPAARELLRLCEAWERAHGAAMTGIEDGVRLQVEVKALRDSAIVVAEPESPDTAEDVIFAARTHLRFVIREYRMAVARLDAFLAEHPSDPVVAREREALVAEARAWIVTQLPKIEQKLARGDVAAAVAEWELFEKRSVVPEAANEVAALRARLRAAASDQPTPGAPVPSTGDSTDSGARR